MSRFQQSTQLTYQPGLKYRVTETLMHKFIQPLPFKERFDHPEGYYSIDQDEDGSWWLIVNPGACWDGASCYFDWKWMMWPSLIHDHLHWAIKRGILPDLESVNDMIDWELHDCIMSEKVKIPWFLGGNAAKGFHARKVMKATNLLNEKRKDEPDFDIITIEI